MLKNLKGLTRLLKKNLRKRIGYLPFGARIEARIMKAALADGRLESLVPIDALTDYYIDAAKDLANPTYGSLTYFEAGVFAGQSLAIWHDVCAKLGIATRSFGADSFEGLPQSAAYDEGGWQAGAFSCPRHVTEWNLDRLGAPVDEIRLIEGWFSETLDANLAAEIGEVHVAMLDADAYSSTVPVLRFLTNLLANPCYLIFDDWYQGGNYNPSVGSTQGLGVERAFREWLSRNPDWVADAVGDYELKRSRSGPVGPAGRILKLTRTPESRSEAREE